MKRSDASPVSYGRCSQLSSSSAWHNISKTKQDSPTKHLHFNLPEHITTENMKKYPQKNAKPVDDSQQIELSRKLGDRTKPLYSRDDVKINEIRQSGSFKRKVTNDRSSSSSSSPDRNNTKKRIDVWRRNRSPSHQPNLSTTKRGYPGRDHDCTKQFNSTSAKKVPYFLDAKREEERLRKKYGDNEKNERKNSRSKHSRSKSSSRSRSRSRDRSRPRHRKRSRLSRSRSRSNSRSRSRYRENYMPIPCPMHYYPPPYSYPPPYIPVAPMWRPIPPYIAPPRVFPPTLPFMGYPPHLLRPPRFYRPQNTRPFYHKFNNNYR